MCDDRIQSGRIARKPAGQPWGLLRLAAIAALALLATSGPSVSDAVEPLGGAEGETLAREALLTPDELGSGNIDGLQYADPAEGLVLVAPPAAGNTGDAELSYPLIVPPGRGITPQLALNYSSGAGNGWVGLGWDLSVSSIEVDTRWGAPHFNPDFESESYLIDGQPLLPNALGDGWGERLPQDREDYTRRVETEYERIIRHWVPPENAGDPPEYYWEVQDKEGNVRWYGGHPDNGGPDGQILNDANGNPLTIDRSAIVYDEQGNGVKWLLSAERDVGVNMIRYHYETIHYKYGTVLNGELEEGWKRVDDCTPAFNILCARHTYLARIDYTAASDRSDEPEDPAYQVYFLLESELDPPLPYRVDPILDGIGGYMDLTIERLGRVQVLYGAPADRRAGTYDQLAARYDLAYEQGPFGKSLLISIYQVAERDDDPGAEPAVHTFEYFDTVSEPDGDYKGFAVQEEWDTGTDFIPFEMPFDTSLAIGALGASATVSGEVHTYVGFNPASPTKTGSFGGSVQVSAGVTTALSEWIDLNGDSLPDKVFLSPSGGVSYRPNRGGANGTTTFGDVQEVPGLFFLSSEGNLGVQISAEAHLGVTAALGLGTDIAIGEFYFADVNADGLPDFVAPPLVYYNHLENGVPTFGLDSSVTAVPLADTERIPVSVNELDDLDLDSRLSEQSPLVDTVRRWIAPFDGTISIDAPVTLSPAAVPNTDDDGVRVAIQLNHAEIASAVLESPGDAAFASAISRAVSHGDILYFRVGSVDDGTNDEVQWNPAITYTAIGGVADIATVPLDVNGLDQTAYSAAADFTLAGRPNMAMEMPIEGTVRFEATVTKTAATTDELRLVLTHNGSPVPGSAVTIAAGFVGDTPIGVSFPVAAPVVPTESNPDIEPSADTVQVHLAADTPIDLTAIAWTPRLVYTAAVDANGDPLDVGPPDNPRYTFAMAPEIEQYPHRSTADVSVPYVPLSDGTYDVGVVLNRSASSPAGAAIVAIRNRTGIVAKQTVALPETFFPVPQHFELDLDAALLEDEEYWFDITIRDPNASDTTTFGSFELIPDGLFFGFEVPATLHWTGRQRIFPLAYRGWAVAGYNANGSLATSPIDPTAFEIDPDDYPDEDFEVSAPDGFDDVDPAGSTPLRAVPYVAVAVADALVLPGQPSPLVPAWRGPRVNLAASAGQVRSSRLGSDSVSIPRDQGFGRGVPRISLTIPSAAVSFGLGPLGGSLGLGPSFGILDYEDMNGDGYPDVVTTGFAQYTDQRGNYIPIQSIGFPLPVNQDLTISAQVGASTNLVDVKGNAKGKTNATSGSAAGKGDDSNESGSGVMPAGIGVNASWTSPNLSGIPDHPLLGDSAVMQTLRDGYADLLALLPLEVIGEAFPLQRALVDMNGDGLPDQVFTTLEGVSVRYNLGYGFTPASIPLTTGGFEAKESYGGSFSLGLGFEAPDGSYAVGGSVNANLDLSRYSWRDINGDGILDQVWNPGPFARPEVAFGTGSGVLPLEPYGETETARVLGGIDLDTEISLFEQISLDSAVGVTAEGDVTIPIGPLCKVACYLIINPGGGAQFSVSSTDVDLQDVDGDGYADSVSTTNDDRLYVRRNLHGTTNLLSNVSNPLGGSFSLQYERYGNTYDHPGSVWALSRVDVNDGRPGDGVDETATAFEYDGLRFDRLHRESLGFATIAEHELDTATDATLRTTVREFLNDNVFTAGLEKSFLIGDPATGDPLRGAESTWGFRNVRGIPDTFDVHDPVSPVHYSLLGDLTAVPSLGMSVAPLLVRIDETWFDGGGVIGQQARMDFEYDGLGNILVQTDHGETEDPNDDLVATYLYSRCDISSSEALGCIDPVPLRTSPLWSDRVCPTWVSLPVEFRITNGKSGPAEVVYRHRDGRTDICDNASVTLLHEYLDDGSVAITELNYDEWGSYDRIVYPAGGDGRRYAVQYEYDLDRHSDIAIVREFDLDDASTVAFLALDAGHSVTSFVQEGLVSSAIFDPLSGRVATRTDANGNTTTYTYDSLGRIKSISSPRPSDPGPLVQYEYAPTEAGYAYAIARHYDAFNPGDTIDTVAFVDGIGRTTQTKRDASLFVAAGQPAVAGRIVSGATNFDALGRPVGQFYPTADTKEQHKYETEVPAGPLTTTAYDLYDMPTRVVEPGGRVTDIAYEYGKRDEPAGPELFRATLTDPRGRERTTFTDVRDLVLAIDDRPSGLSPIRTRFDYDGMGQLLRVVDTAGNESTHSYDMLGRRASTTTPDGGSVLYEFDGEGKLAAKVTPNLAAEGQRIRYAYELGRLVSIDYPAGTPDVSYTYGAMSAPGNGAGRVVRSEDGSRIVVREFSPTGAVVRETAEMKLHAWHNPGTDPAQFQWTTEWTFDGLGRIETMVYPDGEHLTYDYDLGGLIKRISGEEDGFRLEQAGVDPEGDPIYVEVPHTWTYEYLRDQQYDEFLYPRFREFGNGAYTKYAYDPDTLWLTRQQTLSPNRNVNDPAYFEVQDLQYSYDPVGNPLTYENALPSPLSSLFGGATRQSYTYDPYDRIVEATGEWEQADGKLLHYSFALEYDEHGNVIRKNQTDDIFNGKKDLEQKTTTYSYDREFAGAAPHQVTAVGQDTYHYDLNGNLTGIKDKRGKYIRRIEWDATDRMRVVTDGPSDTTYQYDDTGQRTIERGPAGETAFVNPWVTVRNRNEIFKHVWAGDDRIATQRDDGGEEELKRYFLHKDLQGSANMVTDYRGDTFQHHEYFPSGEVWVDESSTVFRTPYQFGGGYVDEVRDIMNFGARWYDPSRELFYSPDPILVDDPLAVIDDPELRAAYSYAGSGPLTYVDPTGLRRARAQDRRLTQAEVDRGRKFFREHPKQAAAIAQTIETRVPRFLVKFALNIERADKLQRFAERWDAKPLLEIDFGERTVKFSFGIGKQLELPLRRTSSQGPQPGDNGPNDATDPGGGPDTGDSARPATGGSAPQGPNPPASDEPSRRGRSIPPPPNKPLPKLPVASGDDGGARSDQ